MRRDIERLHFNTAISSLMELVTAIRADSEAGTPRAAADRLVRMLAPFAPHLAEELWERLGNTESVVHAALPELLRSDGDRAMFAAKELARKDGHSHIAYRNEISELAPREASAAAAD